MENRPSQSRSRGGNSGKGKKKQRKSTASTAAAALESNGRSNRQGDRSSRSNKTPKDVSEEFHADVRENRPKSDGPLEVVDVEMDALRTAARRDPVNWGYEMEVKPLDQWTADYTSPNRSVNVEELKRDIENSLERDARKKRKKEKRAETIAKEEPEEENPPVRQKRRRSAGAPSIPELIEESSSVGGGGGGGTTTVKTEPVEGDALPNPNQTKKVRWEEREEEQEQEQGEGDSTTTTKRKPPVATKKEKKKRKKKEIPKETVSPDELERFFSYEGSVTEDFELPGADRYRIYQNLMEEQKDVEGKLERYGRCNKTNPVEEEKCAEEWRTKLETVSRKYCEDFLRQPKGDNYGERQCRRGPTCVFVLMATRFPDSLENYTSEDGFVCREFLLPSQLEKWKAEKSLPQERRLCLGCNRLYTCFWVYLNLSRGRAPDEILQDHAYEVGRDGEYDMDYCLNHSITQPGAKWTGIARPFVKFATDTYVFSRTELKNRKNPNQSITLKSAQEIKVHFRLPSTITTTKTSPPPPHLPLITTTTTTTTKKRKR